MHVTKNLIPSWWLLIILGVVAFAVVTVLWTAVDIVNGDEDRPWDIPLSVPIVFNGVPMPTAELNSLLNRRLLGMTDLRMIVQDDESLVVTSRAYEVANGIKRFEPPAKPGIVRQFFDAYSGQVKVALATILGPVGVAEAHAGCITGYSWGSSLAYQTSYCGGSATLFTNVDNGHGNLASIGTDTGACPSNNWDDCIQSSERHACCGGYYIVWENPWWDGARICVSTHRHDYATIGWYQRASSDWADPVNC